MPIVFGQETSNVLGEAIMRGSAKVKEREKEISEFDANQARINKNLQNIADNGGSAKDFDSYLKQVENITSGVVPQKPKQLEPITIKNLSLAGARGAVTGTAGLASLPFMALEGMAYLLASTVDDDATFDSFNTISETIQGGGAEINKILNPSHSFERGSEEVERQFVTRAVEKVGEFVTPGAAIVAGMTRKGAQLAARSPETIKWWGKALVQMAQNPAKAQLFEAALNTGAAVGGETAVSLMVDPNDPNSKEKEGTIRLAAEMSTLLGVGVGWGMYRGAQKLIGVAKAKLAVTESQQRKLAEMHIGTLLNEIVESDAVNITARIKAAETLSEKTGVSFFTPDLFQNADLQAAFQKVVQTGHLAPTKYFAVLSASRQRLNKFTEEVAPVMSKGKNIQAELKSFLTKKYDEMDAMLERTEIAALDEVEILNPNRSAQDIGESGLEMVKLLEREALDQADMVYKSIDDGMELSTSVLNSGIQQAKLSPTFRRQNLQRIARGEPSNELANTALDPKLQSLIDIGESNFGKANPKATIGKMVQYRRMVQDQFRIFAIHGDTDPMLRLGRILAGIDGQLNKAAKGNTIGGQQAATLKEANVAYAATKARFDKSFEIVGVQKDITSSYVVTPESFAKRFIKPNSSQNPVQSAKSFDNIFEGDPQAKALIIDAVRLQLSTLKKGDSLSAPAVNRWLNNHSQNLKAHGIWDQFSDIPKTIRDIDETRLAVGIDRKMWERSQLAKFANTENVTAFIQTRIKAGTIGELSEKVRKASPAAHKALIREVWDDILVQSDSGILDNSIVNDSGELIRNVIRTPDVMLKTLTDNADDLTRALGPKHYKALKEIAESVKLQEGTISTGGARSISEAKAPGEHKKATQSMFSKIRSSMQGFVSPQFTLVQLANQGLDILNSGAAVRVVEEAMYDHKYALELAKIAKTAGGKEALRTIWLQMTAYAVASESAFTGNDPREQT